MKLILNEGISHFTFPGSFNPLHQGHINIAKYVHEKYLSLVDFEISIQNVDKPSLTEDEMDQRIQNFQDKKEPYFGSLWITDAPRFTDKAKMFMGTCFIVGYDTFKRICDLKYYKDKEAYDNALTMFEDMGIAWMIFPRPNQEFDLASYPRIRDHAVVESDFVPLDISSTMIRDGTYLQ